MKKGYVISDDRFHKFIVRRLIYFIEETDNYMKINFPPRKYPFEEWKRVYLNVLMDEIHPFLYSFEGIPHQNIYDEIKLTLSNTLSDKMEKMYYDTPISESHWDYNCSSDIIKESTPVIKNKSIEDKIMKSYDRGLSKLFNSDVFKNIYPMIDRSEVFYLEDSNFLILRVYLKDPEIDENNMYSKGFDPHYLMDVHLKKFLPYFDYDLPINTGFVLYGPNGEHITDWIR